jgi:hypothetical protein
MTYTPMLVVHIAGGLVAVLAGSMAYKTPRAPAQRIAAVLQREL